MVTLLLKAIAEGHSEKEDELYLLVYQELHDIASAAMNHERRGHILQPTALIHEVYLRLMSGCGADQPCSPPTFVNRDHFLATAARAMRRILVEHARTDHTMDDHSEFPLAAPSTDSFDHFDLLTLDEALNRLEKHDARMSRIVELLFFAQMTIKLTARILGISTRQVDRDWKAAKSWLHRELSRS